VASPFAGIGIAAYFFLRRSDAADRVAASFAGRAPRASSTSTTSTELYDARVVQPISGPPSALWRVHRRAGLIDGAVNGAGSFVERRQRNPAPVQNRGVDGA